MHRNDLIWAAVRILGIIFLANVILELPSFLILFGTTTYYSLKITFNTTFGTGIDTFLAAGLGTKFLVMIFQAALGLYLMGGGKWFYAKATRDEALAPR